MFLNQSNHIIHDLIQLGISSSNCYLPNILGVLKNLKTDTIYFKKQNLIFYKNRFENVQQILR